MLKLKMISQQIIFGAQVISSIFKVLQILFYSGALAVLMYLTVHPQKNKSTFFFLTIQQFLVYSQCCTTIAIIQFQNISINPKETLQEMGIPDHLSYLLRNLYASQDATVRTRHRTGSKLGKEYFKVVYCHPAQLTYMQGTSCEMPGWMTHKLESRLLKYRQPQISR